MRLRLTALALLASPGLVCAAERLTIEKALEVRELTDLQFSPDGKRVAFTVQEPPSGKTSQRHIWVYDLAIDELRQWTYSAKSEHMPRWSPHGEMLAFLSDREDSSQIWLMPVSGGESRKLTSAKNSIESFHWSRDGKRIAYLATDPKTEAEEKKEKDQEDAKVIDADRKPVRAWTVDVATKAVKRETNGPWMLRDLDWMPDGKHLLAVATDRAAEERRTERIYLVSLDSGAMEEILAPKGPFQKIQVSPGGDAFAFVASAGDGPTAHDLFTCRLDRRVPKNVSGPVQDRPVLGFQWLNELEIAAVFANGLHTELNAVGAKARKLVSDDSLNISSFAVSPAGSVVYVAESAAVLPELWANGKAVSHFNDAFREVPLERPELFRYQSFDGTPIEAALFRGVNASPGRLQPLVVLVHGGPAGAWRLRFDPLTQLLVARGYTVMQPNIRGSVGYGQKFLESNRADWGGGDFKDVMAGVDTLINRKIADPERLAIAGWSYGGYMAEWTITQTNRFKVAVSGAGMADLAAEYGTEARPEGDEWYFGVPYENLAVFQKSSPITYIKNAKTPTLILQGEVDTTDPISQSQILYRGLKRYNVPSEFVVYPREPHGLREQKHIIDRYSRTIAWIEKYLGAEQKLSQ